MIVSELANILLAGSLLPPKRPERRSFIHERTTHWSGSSMHEHDELHNSVLSVQIEALTSEAIGIPTEKRLFGDAKTASVGDELEKAALRWWTEASGPQPENSDLGHDDGGRRESLFSLAGAVVDEEAELSVTVLVRTKEEPRLIHCSIS